MEPTVTSKGQLTSAQELRPALGIEASELPPLPAEPRPGRYRHYKGDEYRVHHLARHSETQEVLVVYQLLYGDHSFWVRPQAMFVETVVHVGQTVPRFAFVRAE